MYIALAARNNGAAQHKIPQPLARRTAIVGSAKGQPRLTNLRVVGHSQKRASSSLAMALGPGPPVKKCRIVEKFASSCAVSRMPAPLPQPLEPSPAIGGRRKSAKPPAPRKDTKSGGSGSYCEPGSVFEGDLEHVQRHRAEGRDRNCLRCIYLSDPRKLEQCAGLPLPSGGSRIWLEPAPSHKGGSWGLGCRICAWHQSRRCGEAKAPPAVGAKLARKRRKKMGKDPEMLRRPQARFSKFANFAWRQPSQMAKTLEQHGNSQAHEVAYKAMLQMQDALEMRPQACVTTARAIIDSAAKQIFKGRVPKPQDWLDCFVESSNLVSWRKQAKLRIGKSGQTAQLDSGEPLAPLEASQSHSPMAAICPSENRQPLAAPRETPDSLRKRRRKQVKIIAECVRRRHRDVLRRARFCSLSLDEAQGRKRIHFRCDYDEPPWYYQGTLGVFQVGAKTMEEGEEDHALKAMTRLDEFISKFCTPLRKSSLGTECDQDLKDHLMKIVVTISADGGPSERRAILLACQPGAQFFVKK